jgi:cell fate regulator YaaT (PSP1 superfamily)
MSHGYDKDLSEDDLSSLEDPADESARAEGPQADAASKAVTEGLFRVKILHSSETILAQDKAGLELSQGAKVIVMTRYGKDLGVLLGRVSCPRAAELHEIVQIDRLAQPDDVRRFEEYLPKEEEAFSICVQKIHSHGLPMKLVSTHYLIDDPKVVFFFTAESRVDFRDLVKDLVSIFKMRIELRQIGVRDEARVTGGLGVCGRAFCCHSLTDKLNPVSIRMAKEQNLSLNSMKISGPCGRLLCCLYYEFGVYHEERKNLPNENTRFNYDGAVFKLIELNVLTGRARLHGDDNRMLEIPVSRFLRRDNHWYIKEEESP